MKYLRNENTACCDFNRKYWLFVATNIIVIPQRWLLITLHLLTYNVLDYTQVFIYKDDQEIVCFVHHVLSSIHHKPLWKIPIHCCVVSMQDFDVCSRGWGVLTLIVLFTSRVSDSHEYQFPLQDIHSFCHRLQQLLGHYASMDPHTQVGVHGDIHMTQHCNGDNIVSARYAALHVTQCAALPRPVQAADIIKQTHGGVKLNGIWFSQ